MYEKLIKALKRAAQKPEIKPALLLEAAGAIEKLEAQIPFTTDLDAREIEAYLNSNLVPTETHAYDEI